MDKNYINRLLVHPNFKSSLEELKKINTTIIQKTSSEEFDFSNYNFPVVGNLKLIESLSKINLKHIDGQKYSKSIIFAGYDESKLKFSLLEGSAFFTSHCLIIANKKQYIPINYLTFYFYSASKKILDKTSFIKFAKDQNSASNLDYVLDRNNFLSQYSHSNSILFIDGPLIGGNISSYTTTLVRNLINKNIIPIFIIKNSESNLVTDNISELKNHYNSDMHWSYNFLKIGQRTNFFLYEDAYNPNNSKVFCYMKCFNLSPQRIEFHIDTYKSYKKDIPQIMGLIYLLFLTQGDFKNPQLRPIAVAEKYARETLKLINTYDIIKSSGLIPTVNQERFGG